MTQSGRTVEGHVQGQNTFSGVDARDTPEQTRTQT
jgi:hypothetical protein